MYIHGFMVPAMISHVFQCTPRCRLAPQKVETQKSSYKQQCSGIRFPGVVQEMCLGGKQNYSFRLTFETFVICDEENASHCFSFVKLDVHDNFVLYSSHSAFL